MLEGALSRAPNYWHYEQSIPKAAASLAHGVGQAQSFEDGNKRTAYWLTHAFLHNNGYGHMMPDDDQELADHLIGYGEGTHGMGDTAAMFEQRQNGTPAGGDPTPPERLGSTSGHTLWFKPRPGVWGRGLVHVPTQTVHTWPEEEGTHAQMAQFHGGILNTEPFAISPEGTVHASGGLNLDRYADLIHEATGFRVGPNQNRLVEEGSETPGWGGQDKQSNILDPIHQSLDPAVWDQPDSSQPKLRADHQKWITDRIFKVLDDHGYDDPAKWLTLILTGSLTTYQYSDDSDCDVSLFVNSEAFPEWSRAEMIGIMISEVDGAKLPGTTHPMQDFVVSRKLSPTDLYKPGLRSGYIVFGDGEGTWVVPPERSRVHDVEKEENEAYTIALENADKMEKLLRYEPDKAVMFWHQIHKRRQRDMQAGKGDFSPSNITYKMLFNRGLTDQLAEVSGEYIA